MEKRALISNENEKKHYNKIFVIDIPQHLAFFLIER